MLSEPDPPFKPSQVVIAGMPPFIGTFGKTEAEVAAAVLVRVSQVEGDCWNPIWPDSITRVMRADIDGGVDPIAAMSRNPFCFPDFRELLERGFIYRTEPELSTKSPVGFTPAGFKGLARWVR